VPFFGEKSNKNEKNQMKRRKIKRKVMKKRKIKGKTDIFLHFFSEFFFKSFDFLVFIGEFLE